MSLNVNAKAWTPGGGGGFGAVAQTTVASSAAPPPPPTSAIAPTNQAGSTVASSANNGLYSFAGNTNNNTNTSSMVSQNSKFVAAQQNAGGMPFFPNNAQQGTPFAMGQNNFVDGANSYPAFIPSAAAPNKGPGDWFRYSFALPTTRVVDCDNSKTSTLMSLQTRRALISGRSKDNEVVETYMWNYFSNSRNSSVTTQQAQDNVVAQDAENFQNLAAVLLSRQKLDQPFLEADIANIINGDGYLIQVAAANSQPGGTDTQQLWDMWQTFVAAIGPSCNSVGHFVLEAPDMNSNVKSSEKTTAAGAQWQQLADVGAAFYHYFFAIPKSPASLSSEEVLNKFVQANKVTKVRSLMSYILSNRVPLAVRVRFVASEEHNRGAKGRHPNATSLLPAALTTAKSETSVDILSTSDENKSTPFAGTPTATDNDAISESVAAVNGINNSNNKLPPPPIEIKYDALNYQVTLDSLQKALTSIERFLMPIAGAGSWSKTALFTIDFVDVTAPMKLPADGSQTTKGLFPPMSALSSPCLTPAFDIIQELSAGLAALGGGISIFERSSSSPVSALSTPLAAFLAILKPTALVEGVESGSSPSTPNGQSASLSDNSRPLLVLSTRSCLARPWGTLPSVFASGARVTPVMSTSSYSGFHLMASLCWEALLTAEYRTLALTTEKAVVAAHVFAQESYVARRTAVGTKVLLLADRHRQLAVFDPQTCSIVMIPNDAFTNRNTVIVDSVFAATLTHSFRGGRNWRLIVDDVYRFNGEPCVLRPFKERWQHIDLQILEGEGAYGHGSPYGPIVLHATYVNPHELHRLVDRHRHTAAPANADELAFDDKNDVDPYEAVEPVDHATLGLTFVPVMTPVIIVSAASASELVHYGANLPPQHHKPRSVNIPMVRDGLRMVPTFVWIPQESVKCSFATGKIEKDGKMAKVYLKSLKSSIIVEATSSESDMGGVVSGLTMLSSISVSDSLSMLLPPPAMSRPAAAQVSIESPAATATKEPVLEAHAKRFWLSWVVKHGNLFAPRALEDVGEYVEVPSALLDLGYITSESVVECLLRRSGTARWWEYTSTVNSSLAADSVNAALQPGLAPSTSGHLSWLMQQTYVKYEDLHWLPKAYLFRCDKCHDVSDKGEKDPANGLHRCLPCWTDGGYGDCVHCNKRFTPGSIDVYSKAFYCEGCWQSFNHPVQIALGPQPPPSGATLEQQVMTRVAALLIDELSKKYPLRDVLDLCVPDISVVRKWLYAGVNTYTGVATDASVMSDMNFVKNEFLQENLNMRRDHFHGFPCPYALTDPDRFWEEAIVPRHPRQFSAIFCFYQLNKIFSSKQLAKDYFKYLARALVPGGIFVSTFFCPDSFFSKGEPYYNEYFGVKWNIQEFEEQRARTFMSAAMQASTAKPAATSPARSGVDTFTPVANQDSGMGSATASAAVARHLSGTSTPIPTSIDEDDDSLQNDSDLPPPPTPPHSGAKPKDGLTTPSNEAASPSYPTDSLTTPIAAGKAVVGSESSSDAALPAAVPTSDSSNNLAANTPTGNTTPLVPSKSAWRPKLSTSSLQSPSAPAATNTAEPTTPNSPAKQAQTSSIPETPVTITTDLTIPTVGLSYRLSFNETGGMGMARDNSSAMFSDSYDVPPTPVSQASERFNSFLVNELARTENVVPLDLLCHCAEEAGFELLFDYWGKAGTLIANDGAWTRPLTPPAKEYFDSVKTIVFRKPAKRPHTTANSGSSTLPPAAL